MEEEKILENITKSITERLKVPIIATYACVLVLYNWDIIFYLIFENDSAKAKIKYIKENYSDLYFERIFCCLFIAIILIIIFTILNTLINFCLKWFYRKDKEITTTIENYESVNILTEQLSKSIADIKILNNQIENLKSINNSLTAKSVNIETSEISQKDYDNLIIFLGKQANSEKLIYSFKELVQKLKKDPKVSMSILYTTATYEREMRHLVGFIFERSLAKSTQYSFKDNSSSYEGLELGTSFKDFLKMEI